MEDPKNQVRHMMDYMTDCPDCGSKVVQSSEEKVCSRCGLVLQEDYFCGRMLLV